MMPAAPLVGAVTTRPPAAFSSLTAIAYRMTRCSASCGNPSAALLRRMPQRGGAAPYVQPARQLAAGFQAARDTAAHHLPDTVEEGIQLFVAAE